MANFKENEELKRAIENGEIKKAKAILGEGRIGINDYILGNTPLILAAANRRDKLCQMLIQNGANLNQSNADGWTALTYAANNGDYEVCRLLIGEGAAINDRDKNGHTPLMRASRKGYNEVCKLLIQRGASLDQRDNTGKTAIHLARTRGHSDTVDLLKRIKKAQKEVTLLVNGYSKGAYQLEEFQDKQPDLSTELKQNLQISDHHRPQLQNPQARIKSQPRLQQEQLAWEQCNTTQCNAVPVLQEHPKLRTDPVEDKTHHLPHYYSNLQNKERLNHKPQSEHQLQLQEEPRLELKQETGGESQPHLYQASKRQTSLFETEEEAEQDNDSGKTVINRKLVIYNKKTISVRSQSTVFLGKFGAIDVAVKRVAENNYFLDKKYSQPEHVSLDQLFQHPNIVRYFDYVQKDGWVFLALEKCDTDLDTEINKWRRESSAPDQKLRVNIAFQICKGLHYLHQKRFIHRDMKPANILLKWLGNKSLSVKICDMGISRKLDLERSTYSETGSAGSPGYKPYELLDAICKELPAEHLSFSVDVFSLGATFHVLLSPGKHPFGEPIFRDVNILKKEDPNIDRTLSYEAQELISNMLKHEAIERKSQLSERMRKSFQESERPSVYKVMEHPFFWIDYDKMGFVCKVSERISSMSSRDIASTNFLDKFKNVINEKLHGGQWCFQLLTRPSWGDKQKTPQEASADHEGTTLGLIRFVRNIWTHRVQNISKGHFTSEDEICDILLGNFPWMVTEIYRLSERHFASNLTVWLESTVRH